MSKIINDKMDFTNYIDIVLMEDISERTADYVNGVVLNCNIADKRMQNRIKNHNLLSIKGNLTY